MKKTLFILLFFIYLANVSLAQKLTAQASKNKVAVGESFLGCFYIVEDFKPPPQGGLNL